MTRINGRMKKWVKEAIQNHEEPFTASEIYSKILEDRGNSMYITSVYSVGAYLSQICEKKKTKEKNLYWRREK